MPRDRSSACVTPLPWPRNTNAGGGGARPCRRGASASAAIDGDDGGPPPPYCRLERPASGTLMPYGSKCRGVVWAEVGVRIVILQREGRMGIAAADYICIRLKNTIQQEKRYDIIPFVSERTAEPRGQHAQGEARVFAGPFQLRPASLPADEGIAFAITPLPSALPPRSSSAPQPARHHRQRPVRPSLSSTHPCRS